MTTNGAMPFTRKPCERGRASRTRCPTNWRPPSALADVERKIDRLVDQIENGLDEPDIGSRLQKRRAERDDLFKTVERLNKLNDRRGPELTRDWIREQLSRLHETLAGEAPAAAHALAQLVGGAIVVTEVREPGRSRDFLRGRFTLHTDAAIESIAPQSAEFGEAVDDAMMESFEIDFVEPDLIVEQSETGETVSTIKRLGFLLADPDPESDDDGPHVIDWDALEAQPGRSREPRHAPAVV